MHWTWACLRIKHCGAQVGRPGFDVAVGEAVVVEGEFEFDVVDVATFSFLVCVDWI